MQEKKRIFVRKNEDRYRARKAPCIVKITGTSSSESIITFSPNERSPDFHLSFLIVRRCFACFIKHLHIFASCSIIHFRHTTFLFYLLCRFIYQSAAVQYMTATDPVRGSAKCGALIHSGFPDFFHQRLKKQEKSRIMEENLWQNKKQDA